MTREYQICTRCVMDTSDPDITFDANGVCNHCIEFEQVTSKHWFPNEEGAKKLSAQIERIKADGKGRDYDCIIGLSGGVDSSYLALKAHEWGLRPLVMHVDAGWNSELAVSNIEKIVNYCGYELHTHVVDWAEMRDLHLAFLRAAIPNQDVPQDHAFFANIYRFATKSDIKWILTGGNLATEGIFPKNWHGSAMDAINLRAIHRKFGSRSLKQYKTISFLQYYLYFPFIKGMRTYRPLNFMPYDKELAIRELESKIGWRSYGRKHGESIFTKFFQNHYLPMKFGFDKRRPHLSSLIVSGQMSREQAMSALSEPLYAPEELERDKAYVASKLGLTLGDFEQLLDSQTSTHLDYPNWEIRQRFARKLARAIARIFGKKEIRVYS